MNIREARNEVEKLNNEIDYLVGRVADIIIIDKINEIIDYLKDRDS